MLLIFDVTETTPVILHTIVSGSAFYRIAIISDINRLYLLDREAKLTEL